ncbi:MAG: sedoheptulokinase [Anaerolineae bacterium]|jgi:sedoheptulokinase|nr:hypothetical protein [Chloroflexota bacterium]
MGITLGLDIGTTSLSAVAFDYERCSVVAQVTQQNDGVRYADLPGGLQFAELDLAALERQLPQLLRALLAQLPDPRQVSAIGVTGQQHGMALLDLQGRPLGAAITWQDQRTLLPSPSGETPLQAFLRLAGGSAAFEPMGCLPAAGYMGPTLHWLHTQGQVDLAGARVAMIPDVAVSLLTGQLPATDTTNGGSSALLDLSSGDWAWQVIDRLGLPRSVFPPIKPAGTPQGSLLPALATASGLAQVPVCVAAGDNQASFAGSMSAPLDDLLVNVGTGGQISALVRQRVRVPGVETRAFFGDAFLLVGAGLYGGRAYAYLRDLFLETARAFWFEPSDDDLFEHMNALAAAVAPGCDGLRFEPLFTGTRDNPDLRASITGIGATNLTPGHLARALLEGIAEGFYQQFRAMQSVLGPRQGLVGAGNGITHNPVLAEAVVQRFDLPLSLTGTVEAAALGAALLAADGTGALPLAEGMASLRYDRRLLPQR